MHKAKGLEWDYVLVESDLKHYLDKARDDRDDDPTKYEEECNIYYVAITRARIGLVDETQIQDPEPEEGEAPGAGDEPPPKKCKREVTVD